MSTNSRVTQLPNMLKDVHIPRELRVNTFPRWDVVMAEVMTRTMDSACRVLRGMAFLQGSRLQFSTAMPLQTMLEVSKVDRSKKGDDIREVVEHANRPLMTHAKQLRSYLLDTACRGEKFVLPAFSFNYGVNTHEDAPSAELLLLASPEDAIVWPAILIVPAGIRLSITDGGHRGTVAEGVLNDPSIPTEQKDAFRRNAFPVTIIFEDSVSDSHQDFADCGKARPIPKSLVAAYDVRDERNRRCRDLVEKVPFLTFYVDATASLVNLSSKSRKIWSLSAVRMFVAYVMNENSDPSMVDGAEQFFIELVRYLPQLQALDRNRSEHDPANTTGALRDALGGDIALRGVGMSIFARAFLFCKESGVSFAEMARLLGDLNWHVLDCERDELPEAGPLYVASVREHLNPLWAPVILIAEDRYRVSSQGESVDEVWEKVRAELGLDSLAEAA